MLLLPFDGARTRTKHSETTVESDPGLLLYNQYRTPNVAVERANLPPQEQSVDAQPNVHVQSPSMSQIAVSVKWMRMNAMRVSNVSDVSGMSDMGGMVARRVG